MNPGDELQSYVIKEILGHGGMGGVFVGENKETKELVAIKTLFEEFSQDEAYVRRFQREASVYRQLNHPNIVQFISSGFDKDVYFIAMEHIGGCSLDKLLSDGVIFPVQDAIIYVTALASAIYHAHSKGIIHRDIKPQNIMIREDGVIKLLDFGVAQTDDDLVKTATGSIVGTFFYASPEQNQGHKIDERSDLYSLGLVFYEMITGQRALAGANPLEIATTQKLGQIPPPESIRKEIPANVSQVIMRLLDRDPNQRFQSARDLENHLKRCSGNSAEVAPAQRPLTNSVKGEVTAADREFEMQWSRAKEALARGELDKALEIGGSLTGGPADRGDVHCFLGKIHAAKGFSYNAIEEFKQAIAIEPSNYQFKIDYAVALYSLNLIDKAKEEFHKVTELDPENPFARQYLQLIDETDSSVNNQIPDRTRKTGFNLSESVTVAQKAAAINSQIPESRSVLDRLEQHTSPSPPPPNSLSQGSASVIPPPVRSQNPPRIASPVRAVKPQVAPSIVAPPAPVPEQFHSVDPPSRRNVGAIPPPVRGKNRAAPEVYPASPGYGGTAREMVLGRTPPKDVTSDLPSLTKEPSLKNSSRSSKSRRKTDEESESTILPETARFWTYVWWGAGKLYGGSLRSGLFWSFVELFIILIVLLPATVYFFPQAGIWENPELDLRVLENKLMTLRVPQVNQFTRAVITPLTRSSFNVFLRSFSKGYVHIFMIVIGVLLFFYYEFKLPSAIYNRILLENMIGSIIEVRHDLTIKINIGENKGVKVGFIFAVQKKKHVNQVSGADFKTMITAPTYFTAGKAKVTSTASNFSICKFKRLPGEASSPSEGDHVVVMSGNL